MLFEEIVIPLVVGIQVCKPQFFKDIYDPLEAGINSNVKEISLGDTFLNTCFQNSIFMKAY